MNLIAGGSNYRYASIGESRLNKEEDEESASTNVANKSMKKEPKTVIEAFERDAKEIQKIWVIDPSLAPTDVSIGSTYTKLWNHEMWRNHMNINRYFRHLAYWPKSTIAKSIVPVTICVIAWSCFVRAIAYKYQLQLEIPFTCAILFGQAITLLLTLRTNQSLARVQEARTVTGKIVTQAREVAALSSCYLYPNDPNLAIAMSRYICAYGFALKRYVRGHLDEYAVNNVYCILLPNDELKFIQASPRPFLFFLKRARQCLARAAKLGFIERTVHRSIEIKLGALNDLAGICERIILSPSPTAYTRHTSRVLLIFLLLIPVGLESLDLGPKIYIFMAFFVTYLLVGIEQIGVELEEPFRWLPLRELTLQLLEDVVHEFTSGSQNPQTLEASLPPVFLSDGPNPSALLPPNYATFWRETSGKKDDFLLNMNVDDNA